MREGALTGTVKQARFVRETDGAGGAKGSA